MRSPAPSRRAMALSGRTAVAVRPRPVPQLTGGHPRSRVPAPRRPVPGQRLPGRRTIRIGGKRYDVDQVRAVVGITLTLVFLGSVGPAVVEEAVEIATGEPASTTAGGAQPVLDLALTQVGTVEGRGGGTPFHDQYGIADNQPWCAVWVWTVFANAGRGDLVPKTAWTPAMAQYYRDRDRWSDTPQVGDLVFYNWVGDGTNRIQHVGIVLAVSPDSITTLEGNTSPGAGGSQSNGDGVYQRTRPRNSSIVGYGHPAYT